MQVFEKLSKSSLNLTAAAAWRKLPIVPAHKKFRKRKLIGEQPLERVSTYFMNDVCKTSLFSRRVVSKTTMGIT